MQTVINFRRFVLFLGLAGLAPPAPSQPRSGELTVPIRVDLDLTKAGSSAQFEVRLTEYRIYQVMLEFTPTHPQSASWLSFIGTGQQIAVRADTASGPHPVPIEPFTPEERAVLDAGGRVNERQIGAPGGGTVRVVDLIGPDGKTTHKTYEVPPVTPIFTQAGAGSIVPLHLKVENVDGGKPNVDGTLRTSGTVNGGTRRAVLSMPLLPGRYRIRADNVDAQPLADGSRPQVLLTFDPKVVPADK